MFKNRLSIFAAAAALAMSSLGFGNQTLQQRLNPSGTAIDIRGMGGSGGGGRSRYRRPRGRHGEQRYPHAREGGNWQGNRYVTYAEHDAATILRLQHNRTAGTLMQWTQEDAIEKVVADREERVEQRSTAQRERARKSLSKSVASSLLHRA